MKKPIPQLTPWQRTVKNLRIGNIVMVYLILAVMGFMLHTCTLEFIVVSFTLITLFFSINILKSYREYNNEEFKQPTPNNGKAKIY